LILSFCTKDELLEQIWTRSNNWYKDESFWDGVAAYTKHETARGLDASLSVEFSCFADAPRMEHLLNIKRNIISAHELSHRGVPIILDAIVRTKLDLKRTLEWGSQQGLCWYLLNFQRTKNVPWMMDLISERLEQVFEAGGKAIVSGIANTEMISKIMDKYRGRVSITNTIVSMKTNYYQEFNGRCWQKSKIHGADLLKHNLAAYCNQANMHHQP
jgi:phosphoribosyl-AMP cyclohydrolase